MVGMGTRQNLGISYASGYQNLVYNNYHYWLFNLRFNCLFIGNVNITALAKGEPRHEDEVILSDMTKFQQNKNR
jgi:hypothetical protein